MIIRTGNLPPSVINTNPQDTQNTQNVEPEVKQEVAATSVDASADSALAQNDTQKIENIKNQIANGIYEIDLRNTANKMAQEMLFYYRQ